MKKIFLVSLIIAALHLSHTYTAEAASAYADDAAESASTSTQPMYLDVATLEQNNFGWRKHGAVPPPSLKSLLAEEIEASPTMVHIENKNCERIYKALGHIGHLIEDNRKLLKTNETNASLHCRLLLNKNWEHRNYLARQHRITQVAIGVLITLNLLNFVLMATLLSSIGSACESSS